jgi:hypothetical protein
LSISQESRAPHSEPVKAAARLLSVHTMINNSGIKGATAHRGAGTAHRGPASKTGAQAQSGSHGYKRNTHNLIEGKRPHLNPGAARGDFSVTYPSRLPDRATSNEPEVYARFSPEEAAHRNKTQCRLVVQHVWDGQRYVPKYFWNCPR